MGNVRAILVVSLMAGLFLAVQPPVAAANGLTDAVRHELSRVLRGDPIARCMKEEDNSTVCIGRISSACEQNPLVRSFQEVAFCVSLEYEAWDTHLNRAYGKLRRRLAAEDAEDGRLKGISPSSRTGNLKEMQRGWIRYRDGRCNFERSLIGTSAWSAIDATRCMTRLTGEQVIYLMSYLDLD